LKGKEKEGKKERRKEGKKERKGLDHCHLDSDHPSLINSF
jgi:hypothetical protein